MMPRLVALIARLAVSSLAWILIVQVPVSLKVSFSLSPRSRLMPLNEASSASLSSWSRSSLNCLTRSANVVAADGPWLAGTVPSSAPAALSAADRVRSRSRGSRCAACRCRWRPDLVVERGVGVDRRRRSRRRSSRAVDAVDAPVARRRPTAGADRTGGRRRRRIDCRAVGVG